MRSAASRRHRRPRSSRCRSRARRPRSHCAADAAGQCADDDREQRAEQEEEEGAAEQDRGEIAPRDDEGRAPQRQARLGGLARSSRAPRPGFRPRARAAAASPAMATKASCRPARSIDSDRMPASPSISARSSGSIPLSGSGKCQKLPSRRASAGRAARHGPSLARGFQPHLRRDAVARLVDLPGDRAPCPRR